MNYRSLLCAAVVSTLSVLPGFAQGVHSTAVPIICGSSDTFFSQFVNIGGGLYWTGGANPDDHVLEDGYPGLRIDVPGVPARTVTMQYFAGPLSPGPQGLRNNTGSPYVVIFFTDGSLSNTGLNHLSKLSKGFSTSPAGHGFINLTWNAVAAGESEKFISKVYFADEGAFSQENQSFQDYVTRVYINGILAVPLTHDGFVHDCGVE